MEKQTKGLISCVSEIVTRVEGFRKSENFADVMNRSPLSFQLVSDDDVVSQEVFHMALEGH